VRWSNGLRHSTVMLSTRKIFWSVSHCTDSLPCSKSHTTVLPTPARVASCAWVMPAFLRWLWTSWASVIICCFSGIKEAETEDFKPQKMIIVHFYCLNDKLIHKQGFRANSPLLLVHITV
jgi:hypothetical protein